MNLQNPCQSDPGIASTSHPGKLFILSAPSGAGKTTLRKALLTHFQDILYSVSTTTRKPRLGEENGRDYHFLSKDDFVRGIALDQWAEWAKVHDNYYGTPAEFLDTQLAVGKEILLDIDVQGTIQILKRYPDSITIFIMPPSLDTLKKRMEARGTDSPSVIEKRLMNAKDEMAKKDLYRHIMVNDSLEKAKAELISIVEFYRRNTD